MLCLNPDLDDYRPICVCSLSKNSIASVLYVSCVNVSTFGSSNVRSWSDDSSYCGQQMLDNRDGAAPAG